MHFNFSGNMDNFVFNDEHVQGVLKFKDLYLQGDTAFIDLNNHTAEYV